MTAADRVRVTQIDAFTDRPFSGNPAAVVLVDEPADPVWMQALAAEVGLSETAFLHPLEGRWGLRWFTPTVEVALCGHATLASAHHLLVDHGVADPVLRFDTASGELTATPRADGWIELDLPADPVTAVPAPEGLLDALGLGAEQVVGVSQGRTDLLIEVADAQVVRGVAPDFVRLGRFRVRGVSVSARGEGDYDIVSRFFGPGSGVDEDPVTGSAHCTLGPYWAAKLGRPQLLAYQASARGGVLRVDVSDRSAPPWRGRVRVAGQAVHALQRV
jgi:PhzF family phenazine biosynthesis protein